MSIHRMRAMLLVIWLSSAVFAEIPTIDGVFSEWRGEQVVVRDDEGDATGSFDVTKVAAATNGTELYLCFDIGTEINLQSGDEIDGTLGLVVDLPQDRQLTIDFRKRTATLNNDTKQPVAWSQIAFACLPTYASDQYELRIDLNEFGLHEGDTIKLNFQGSDKLAEPASIVLRKGQQRRSKVTLARSSNTDVRIANLNTLREGLSDVGRSESFRRLLAAAQADIFCFQEEWEEDKFREAAPLMVPMEHPVNLHWFGGCGIATALPLEPIAMKLDRGAAAAIELRGSRQLVVISVHLKCCGYTGSREDRTRIRQAQQLVGQVRALRNGEFGEELQQAGIVIIGDYNLVGSRKPLDIIKTAGMTDWILPGMVDGAAITWRGIRKDESFWPGRLDALTYDQATLEPLNGCVVDTSRLFDEVLSDLGLRAHDSLASDHLLLVADFQFVR